MKKITARQTEYRQLESICAFITGEDKILCTVLYSFRLKRKILLHSNQIAFSNPVYCQCIIFSVYDIWRLDFLLFSVDFLYPLIQTFTNAHLAVNLILQRDSTAKGASSKEYIAKCNTFAVYS